jgi:hypothetical protein
MSALKQVLNRRLFRQNGMLGPENPQGILNSSNELANTVRMQNGGEVTHADAYPYHGKGPQIVRNPNALGHREVGKRLLDATVEMPFEFYRNLINVPWREMGNPENWSALDRMTEYKRADQARIVEDTLNELTPRDKDFVETLLANGMSLEKAMGRLNQKLLFERNKIAAETRDYTLPPDPPPYIYEAKMLDPPPYVHPTEAEVFAQVEEPVRTQAEALMEREGYSADVALKHVRRGIHAFKEERPYSVPKTSSEDLLQQPGFQDGGVHIARAPGPVLDVPGMPSEDLFYFTKPVLSAESQMRDKIEQEEISQNTNEEGELTIDEEELAIRVEARMRKARLEGTIPEDDTQTSISDRASTAGDWFQRRRDINRYNLAYPDIGFLPPNTQERLIAEDPRRAFTYKNLREAQKKEPLGAEELRREFPQIYEGTYAELIEESGRKKPTGTAVVEDAGTDTDAGTAVVGGADTDADTAVVGGADTDAGTAAVEDADTATGEEAALTEVPESTPEGQEVANTVGAIFDRFGQVKDDDLFRASLVEAKDRFIDTLPQYQGKTEFEKGMTLAKMGMAIAAGQDPHAIKNIADGFLAVGDEFVEDAKQKRLYDQQVQLQAANYGLDYMKNISTKLSEWEKTRDTLHDYSVRIPFTDAQGIYHPEGSPYPLSTRQLNEGVPYLKYLASDNVMTQRLKNAGAVVPLLDFKPKDMAASRALITNNLTEAETNGTMLAFVDSALVMGQEGKVTGVGAFWAKQMNSLANAIFPGTMLERGKKLIGGLGQTPEEFVVDPTTGKFVNPANFKKSWDELQRLKKKDKNIAKDWLIEAADEGADVKLYDLHMHTLANMMIRQILGEGSKNISNIDRKLAQELVGLMGDWERITADPRVLEQKLLNIRGRIVTDYNRNLENINGAISDVSDWNVKKSEELQGQADRTYEKLRKIKRGSPLALQGQTALKVSDYFDTDFNLIKPFPS